MRKIRLVHMPEVANALREAGESLISVETHGDSVRVADLRAAGIALTRASVALRSHIEELQSHLNQEG